MKSPTVTEIKDPIIASGKYRLMKVLTDELTRSMVRVEFDLHRRGVDCAVRRTKTGHRELWFRLAENWHEAVWPELQQWAGKWLVLSAQVITPPGGMNRAWKTLVADQTRHRLMLRPVYRYCVEFDGTRVWSWQLRDAQEQLLRGYRAALLGEDKT